MSTSEETHSEIHSTRLRRLAVRLAIRLFGRFCRRSNRVIFLTRNTCIKYGSTQRLSEAATLAFVAKHSSVPVPKVHCAFIHNGCTYIVMERLHGDNTAKGWLSRSEASKIKIRTQLRGIVDEIRQIQRISTSQAVSSVDGGPIWDERLPWSGGALGPFSSVQEFHRHLRNGFHTLVDALPEVQTLVDLQEQTSSAVCFTHSDLSSFNILVSGDQVVGIVDWESAGWYPLYWEYVNAWYVNPLNTFWQAEVDSFLDTFPRELRMDKLRRKYFGDYQSLRLGVASELIHVPLEGP